MERVRRSLLVSLPILFLLAPSAGAALYEYGFRPIIDNSGQAGFIAPQLSFTVQSYTGPDIETGVLFTIYNNAPAPSPFHDDTPITGSIDKVLFDDGTLFSGPVIIDSPPVVDFVLLSNPGDKILPDGNLISWETSMAFGADAREPSPFRGVNPGESLGLAFALEGGKDLDSVLAALALGMTDPTNDESLRIGLHLISPNGLTRYSDSYVSVVPLPASILLGVFAVGLVGRKLRKFV
jgi:hypothetical protein